MSSERENHHDSPSRAEQISSGAVDGGHEMKEGLRVAGPQQGYQWAIRIATELVTSIAIGIGIGYGLDRWLDSRPWLTLLFFLFGVAAGFLNLYRAVQPRATGTDDPHSG